MMSVKSLIKAMEKTNIAEDLDDDELHEIASNVIQRADEDRQSMKDWMDCVDEGLRLCKPEFVGKSEPWEGAANYKSTLLTEASNDFGNRASMELMRDRRLVKAEIIGLETLQNVIEKKSGEIAEMQAQLDGINAQAEQLKAGGQEIDPEIQKQIDAITNQIKESTAAIKQKKLAIRDKSQRADRVTEVMNWQINSNMKEWRKDQKRLMYSLPNMGTIFKKTFYDEALGRCVSHVINYPDFIVNQATVCIDEARSFTHVFAMSESRARERIKAGIWREVDRFKNYDADNDDGIDDDTNESNKTINAMENPDAYYEQYCWIDLDNDGCEEPYIVTVHKASQSVMRIVARFDFDGIIVKYKEMRPMPLLKAQRERAADILKDAEEFGVEPELPDAMDLTGFKVVRIDPKKVLTKYGFIPSYDGSFLDMGFFHFLGSATLASNKATNDLLDAGTLANTAMGISAKGFRKRQGDFKFKKGQIMATEIPADQLQSSIYMLNFKEPSQTLFQLNEGIKASAGSFIATADAGGQIQSNTSPTTTLAIIQESMVQQTAHMGLIIDSMGDEFEILFNLNSEYLNDEEYRAVVGDDEASYADDFATDGLSIVCGANPEMSSRSQRMMLADAELAQIPLVMQAGGNPVAILKNWFNAIGSTNINEYFPNEAEMSPQDRASMQQMKAAQEQANALQEQQNKLQELQIGLLSRAEDRKDAELQVTKQKTLADVDKTIEQTQEVKANTLLTLEKAESEQVNNQLSIYTTRSEQLMLAEEAQEAARMIDE
jgi:hypothetical protein